MHITDRLNKEMEFYTAKTGKKCWALYLGRTEMKELLGWANETTEFPTDDLEGKKRPQYNGALVYEVNDDDHLNVS
jgi:hypothetical protein